MDHQSDPIAAVMTESALALAASILLIMVPVMILVGPIGSNAEPQPTAAVEVLRVHPNANDAARTDTMTPAGDDIVVIFDGQRFLDTSLAPADPGKLGGDGRIFLAVPPSLSHAETIGARRLLGSREVLVTTLNERWLERLGRTQP